MERNYCLQFHIESYLQCLFIASFLLSFETVSLESLPIEDLQTLKLLHIVFRHGNRTPIKENLYQNDPYANETYYPHGWGELNTEGKRNAYDLGLLIRDRYNGFIPETYYPPDIIAYTTNISRTQMTLQSVLSAIYTPVWPNIILPYLMWQPISYQTLPTKGDYYMAAGNNCPNFNAYTTKMDSKLKQLYEYVQKHAGSKMVNSNDIMNVYNSILVEKENGFEVSDWAKEIFNNGSLQSAGLDRWQDIIDKKLPLMSGKLIEKITTDTQLKINQRKEEPKVFFYSGHDTNIATLLGVFDAYQHEEINYLAHFFIEFHKINDIYGFKIYFQNGLNNSLVPLTFKECTDTFCSLDNFIASTKYLYETAPKCN